MAKKTQKRHQAPKDFSPVQTTGKEDARQMEAVIKQEFSLSLRHLRSLEKKFPNLIARKDMDSLFSKRRIQAAIALAPRIKELAEDICPDIPDLFSIYEDWGRINALPVKSYDEQEENMYLILGASIWILDRIKQSGQIREAIRLLPKDDGGLDDVDIPDIYDPVHQDEVIRAMVFSVTHRNDDCLQPGQKVKKKSKKTDPLNRVIADRFTVKNQQHQQVPSRIRFETLLSLIPQREIEKAIESYEDRLFAWMERYYRCRAIYCEKEKAAQKRQKQFAAMVEVRTKQIMELHKRASDPIRKLSPVEAVSVDPLQQSLFGLMNSEPMQLIQQIEEESQQIEDALDALEAEITKFVYRSHLLGTYPYDRLQKEFGKEIADIVADFSFGDPYEMCFAFLYLLDQNSDLPWLYYPGIVLSENAGAMLPWFEGLYAEDEDDHWAQYYDKNFEPEALPPKHVPELADWYRLDYIYQKSDPEFQFKNNLAQIVYDVTGGLMPRNLHSYDDGIQYLRKHGITGKKMQIPLLYCMTLLGEGRFQSRDWRVPFQFQDDMLDSLVDSVQEKMEETLGASASDNELQEQLLALKKENNQLKRAAYEAERTAKELQKKIEDLLQKGKSEGQELAELRELLFLHENERETAPEDAESISFPYPVKHATVIFGGHDTWAKAIRPMLSGDVRFVDRDMRPDADLIRHAEVVWLQPNSMSHSNYHKIIHVVRTHHITLHYFQFASAEKCALQLVREDQKMG